MEMEQLNAYQEYLKKGLDYIMEFLPNLITAAIILLVGLWIIRIINKAVHRFFERKDYDLTLETFLQSLIKNGLKLLLFVQEGC